MEEAVEDLGRRLSEICDESPFVANIVVIAVNCVSLLIVLIIGMISMRNVLNAQIYLPLKILYCSAIPSSALALSTLVTMYVQCYYFAASTANAIALYCFIVVTALSAFSLLCSLGTLVLRSISTFDKSAYRMSIRIRIGIWSLFISMILIIVLMIGMLLWLSLSSPLLNGTYFNIAYPVLGFLFIMLYLMASGWTVHFFVSALLNLGRSRTSSEWKRGERLNADQLKLVDLTARYLYLFVIAAVSSFVTVIIGMVLSIFLFLPNYIFAISAGTDFCVNIVCLYLQYNFAAEHYDTFCCGMDHCCRVVMMRLMETSDANIENTQYALCPEKESAEPIQPEDTTLNEADID